MSIDLNEQKIAVDGRFYPISMPNNSTEQGMSVTTVLGFVRVKSFLDEWEWEMQRELGLDGLKAYMDKKGWEGTCVHDMAEEYLRRAMEGDATPFEWTDDINKYIWKKFITWVAWYKDRKPKVIWTERKLQTVELLVGGRADALLEVKAIGTGKTKLPGGRGIFDYKTSKDYNEKHLIQLSAYMKMWEEETGEVLDFGSVVIVGAKTIKGWKEVSIQRSVIHEGSGLNEVEHYWEGFKRAKSMVDWALSDLKPNDYEYPRYIVPQSF